MQHKPGNTSLLRQQLDCLPLPKELACGALCPEYTGQRPPLMSTPDGCRQPALQALQADHSKMCDLHTCICCLSCAIDFVLSIGL
jgi:hypothetical protein